VTVGAAQLTGIVDNITIDPKTKTITVVDYKTGRSYSRWLQDARLYRYRRQLYLYKLLIENSTTYTGYTVTLGRLEFVEPDDNGRINTLELEFNTAEMDRVKKLIAAMWKHVMEFNFPSTQRYDATLAGIKQFEDDLIAGKI
jgi:RecB family exonuclease